MIALDKDNNMSGSDTNIDSHGGNLHATRNSQLQHEEEEYDKFQLFERWLLHNGAQFPFLELRAQNVNQSTDDDNDDDMTRSLALTALTALTAPSTARGRIRLNRLPRPSSLAASTRPP